MTPMRESSSHSPISQKSRQLLGTMPPLIPSDEQIHRIRQSLDLAAHGRDLIRFVGR